MKHMFLGVPGGCHEIYNKIKGCYSVANLFEIPINSAKMGEF